MSLYADNYRAWYDEIGLWNTQSGRFSPLVKATVPNGLIVGPFAGNGQSLFYWDDPDHSASLQADGLTLHYVTMSGHTQTVGHTFARGGFMPAGVQVFGRCAGVRLESGRGVADALAVFVRSAKNHLDLARPPYSCHREWSRTVPPHFARRQIDRVRLWEG